MRRVLSAVFGRLSPMKRVLSAVFGRKEGDHEARLISRLWENVRESCWEERPPYYAGYLLPPCIYASLPPFVGSLYPSLYGCQQCVHR